MLRKIYQIVLTKKERKAKAWGNSSATLYVGINFKLHQRRTIIFSLSEFITRIVDQVFVR